MTEAQRIDVGPRPAVHQEIFQGTLHTGEIRVSCVCSLGADHTYSEGLKYLGSVDIRGSR